MNTRLQSRRTQVDSVLESGMSDIPTIFSDTTASFSDPTHPDLASNQYASERPSGDTPRDSNLDIPSLSSRDTPARKPESSNPVTALLAEQDLSTFVARAKDLSIDVNTLLIHNLLTRKSLAPSAEPVHPRPNPYGPDKLVKLIGKLGEGEDIVVFLNRFETELGSRGISLDDFRLYLPYCLSGAFKEAYYNNVSQCPRFNDIRLVLLNTGGYSLTECLNSFPLKFRPGGSKSLIQWFNHWRYKLNILIGNLPFSKSLHPNVRDEMADTLASIGVLAGLPQDHRDAVVNRPCLSSAQFVQECNAWYLASHQSHPKFSSSSQHHKYSSDSYNSSSSIHRQVYQSQSGYGQSPPRFNGQGYQRPNNHPNSGNHHSDPANQCPNSPTALPRPSPYPRRDLATVTCFRCNRLGHYANNCPYFPNKQTSSQPSPAQPTPNTNPQPTRPLPVPRTNSRPIRKVETLDEPLLSEEPTPLNHFVEEDIVTFGKVNGIDTPIIVDSGAKISLISDDFIELDYNPVKFVTISGISQECKSVPVFSLPVSMPTLEGDCLLAVDSRLPPEIVLLGLDFGRQHIIDLINHLKSEPQPIMTVTRAMQLESDLAAHTADILHTSEGAQPLSFDDIPIVNSLPAESETLPDDLPVSQQLALPKEIPTLTFDGVSKQDFVSMQLQDESLAPLWEFAEKGMKNFFIVDGTLMCLNSTLNSVSHALVVPTSLRPKVLIAAHQGLGHGGINTTRALINKHFTWPNLAADVRNHVMSCEKCLVHNKSGAQRVPMLEPEIVSERCEKLAFDIVGPLPTSKSKFRFILTCLEMASGFPFAVPLKTYTSEETAKAILSVISVLGTTLVILTDQGSNFMSLTLTHLKRKLNVSSIGTSAYHPQSNGRLERFHSTLKAMLAKCLDHKQDWPLALDLVLHFARNIPNSRHGFTPHELLFLKPSPFILSTLKSLWSSSSVSSLNLPQFIEDLDNLLACQNHHVKSVLSSKSCKNRISVESELASKFKVGDSVYKRNPGHNKCLEASWDGPYTIKSLLPPVNCAIAPSNKKAKAKVVHLSQLKKSLPIYRTILVPDECADNEFLPPINTSEPITLSLEQQSSLESILGQFPEVFTNKPGITSLIKHSISVTCDTPLWTPSYSIPLSYQEPFRVEIQNMLDMGVIEPSISKWSSPPLPVKKKDGGIRIVIDFRKLNSVTVREPFTMPSIDYIISHLGSASFLSKLDLLKGFYQVPMEDDSKKFTAFTCLQGKFQFKVMPFGLTNAPSTFQLLMQSTLRGLEPFCLPYIDDLVIFSSSFEQHLTHITSVLSRLKFAGLTVKKEKCAWCFASFDFLGFHVGKSRLSIPSEKVSSITSYRLPLTKSSLKSFIGLITFYARFIPNLSQFTSVLNGHLTKNSPDRIQCTNDYVQSFNAIIGSISHHTSLIIPVCNDALCVYCDASLSGLGGTLCVFRNNTWSPAEFYSRQLTKAEKNYSILDLEAAALLATVEHFRYLLAGRYFKAFTDHRPLIDIIRGPAPSSRLTRWKIRLMEFHFDLYHVNGEANAVADALSRQSWSPDV